MICKIIGHKRIDGVYEGKVLPYCDRCNCDLPLTKIQIEERNTNMKKGNVFTEGSLDAGMEQMKNCVPGQLVDETANQSTGTLFATAGENIYAQDAIAIDKKTGYARRALSTDTN